MRTMKKMMMTKRKEGPLRIRSWRLVALRDNLRPTTIRLRYRIGYRLLRRFYPCRVMRNLSDNVKQEDCGKGSKERTGLKNEQGIILDSEHLR